MNGIFFTENPSDVQQGPVCFYKITKNNHPVNKKYYTLLFRKYDLNME